MARRIAIIPGDGIGPEVAAIGIRLLSRVSEARGLALQFDWFEIIGQITAASVTFV